MLAGRRPFVADTASGMLFAILSSDPEPVAQARPGASPPLAHIVQRAIAKTPSRRFASMAEVVAALDAIGGGTAQPAGCQ